jgi:hypothetical protein
MFWPEVEMVAKELMEKKELSYAEIQDLLKTST